MRRLRTSACALLMLGLGACGGAGPLPQGPVADSGDPGAQIHFVTDRAVEITDGGAVLLTARRDAAMRFGTAQLGAGDAGLKIDRVAQRLTFPATPLALSQSGGVIGPDPSSAARYAETGRALQDALAQDLRKRDQRDILLYIHGYNSHFNDALETTARLWQATGQGALPLAYSWPSGNPGAFGYFKDRESGEFTIFHLKETLRLLSTVPGLNRIHIVAHSRGSDVVTTALRELVIEARAAGRDPRQSLKIENLILAAPDLDFSVVRQRLIAERFGLAFGRITVYMNPEDGALGLAQFLMAGTRFGRLSYDQLGLSEREIFAHIRNVHFINVSAVTGGSSHNYFRSNPAVLADIARVIATNAAPDDPRRDLIHAEANFWRLVPPRDTAIDAVRAER
ncbi:MAG: alpha/beta hydrolase [Roseovarius sp.]